MEPEAGDRLGEGLIVESGLGAESQGTRGVVVIEEPQLPFDLPPMAYNVAPSQSRWFPLCEK